MCSILSLRSHCHIHTHSNKQTPLTITFQSELFRHDDGQRRAEQGSPSASGTGTWLPRLSSLGVFQHNVHPSSCATCIGNTWRAIDLLLHAQVGGKVSEAMGTVKENVGKAFGANQCAPVGSWACCLTACTPGRPAGLLQAQHTHCLAVPCRVLSLTLPVCCILNTCQHSHLYEG